MPAIKQYIVIQNNVIIHSFLTNWLDFEQLSVALVLLSILCIAYDRIHLILCVHNHGPQKMSGKK